MSRPSSWLNDFIGTVEGLTDSPTLFITAAAYFTAGAALKKQVFYRENKDIYPNLYYLLVAPPYRYHKTYALELGHEVLKADCGTGMPVILDKHFLPQDGSDVAFDDAMGEAEGYGIAYYEEFSKFVGSAKREHTSQMGIKFLEYFNPSMVDKKSKTRKDGERVIKRGSVVNFASACTEDDFQTFMSSGSVSSGQISRCLIFRPTERDAREPYEPIPQVPVSFYTDMAEGLRHRIPRTPQQMVFSKDATEMIKEYSTALLIWYREEPNGAMLRRATGRAIVILRRLSMIHATMRGSYVIKEQDVQAPWDDIITPYLRSIKWFTMFGVQDTGEQILRSKIYRKLEEEGPAPVRVLSRDLNESVDTITKAVKTLIDQGRIYQLRDTNGLTFFASYDDVDGDQNTPVHREIKAMKEFRSRFREDKSRAQNTIYKDEGALKYEARNEGK